MIEKFGEKLLLWGLPRRLAVALVAFLYTVGDIVYSDRFSDVIAWTLIISWIAAGAIFFLPVITRSNAKISPLAQLIALGWTTLCSIIGMVNKNYKTADNMLSRRKKKSQDIETIVSKFESLPQEKRAEIIEEVIQDIEGEGDAKFHKRK